MVLVIIVLIEEVSSTKLTMLDILVMFTASRHRLMIESHILYREKINL